MLEAALPFQVDFPDGLGLVEHNASSNIIRLTEINGVFVASTTELLYFLLIFLFLCASLLDPLLRKSSQQRQARQQPLPMVPLLIELVIVALFAETLTECLLNDPQPPVWMSVGIRAASCVASCWNVATIFLRLSPTKRGVYHLVSCMAWTWLLDSRPYSEVRIDFAWPWIFAISFLMDLFYYKPPDTVSHTFPGLRLFEKLSYAWLNPLVELHETLDADHLPNVDLPADFGNYLVSFRVTCTAQGDSAGALKPFWQFILRKHTSPMIVGGVLRLLDDISKFSLPFLLREVLAGPSMGKTMFLFCTRVLGALCGNYSGYYLRDVSAKYKALLSAALHQKALEIGDTRTGTADIVTLGEVDSQTLYRGIQQYHDTWAFPLQVVLCLGGLAYLLPWEATLAVVGGIIFMYPAVGYSMAGMGYWMQKNLAAKDYRTVLMSEVIRLILPVKIQGWEHSIENAVAERRSNELRALQGVALSNATLICLMQAIPAGLTLAAFGVITFIGSSLDNRLIFSSIMLFTMLNATLMQLSGVANVLKSVQVSTSRIVEYLNQPRQDIGGLEAIQQHRPTKSFQFDNVHLSWPGNVPVVSEGRLEIDRGKVTAVTGTTGSGKSTLLIGLYRYLEQLELPDGNVSLSYLTQTPILIGGTVRENILFGQPYDAERYKGVVEACCLVADVQQLPHGDRTAIMGSIPLSGGQKARICLARAVYLRADVYILDDPFAALDVKVQSTITRLLLGPKGLLSTATVIVASHSALLLDKADSRYFLERGRIVHTPISRTNLEVIEDADIDATVIPSPASKSGLQTLETEIPNTDADTRASLYNAPDSIVIVNPKPKSRGHPIVGYIASARPFGWPLAIGLLFTARSASVYSVYTLKTIGSQMSTYAVFVELGIFGLYSTAQTILFFLFVLALYQYCIIPAAATLHARLVSGILAQRLRFFELTPMGDIINLFTNDISRIDGSLNGSIISMVAQLANLGIVFTVLITAVPLTFTWVLPMVLFCTRLLMVYAGKVRDLRQLDVVSRAPVINYLQEAEQGRLLFRAHNLIDERIKKYQDMVQVNMCALVPFSCLDLWLGLRLEVLSVALQAVALTVLSRSVQVDTLGFVMTYVFQVTATLSTLAKVTSQFEADTVSITRINEYANNPAVEGSGKSSKYATTALAGLTSTLLAPSWPSEGKIELRSVTARYNDDTPPTLNSLDLTIQPGEKIAVVGRTGAGKSSLIMCLLGLMEQTNGQIFVDSMNILDMDPIHLRQSFALIQQHPAVFPTSIRWNLDPFGICTDEEIYDALEKSKAKEALVGMSKQRACDGQESFSILDTQLDFNLSSGELQLLALARVMLRKSKVVILDEATSGLDPVTEAWIHENIFDQFEHSTIIAVMHKLELTVKYDKILVLRAGQVAEFDTPANLLNRPGSIYLSMIAEAGLTEIVTASVDSRLHLSL